MKRLKYLTAIIEKEDDGYVALCPEVDVASQGDTVEEATSNLREALELFFESASEKEIESRLRSAQRDVDVHRSPVWSTKIGV